MKNRLLRLILCALCVASVGTSGVYAKTTPDTSTTPMVSEVSEMTASRSRTSETVPISTAKAASAKISAFETTPGETLFITLSNIQNIDEIKVKNSFEFSVRFSKLDKSTWIAFLPISYHTAVGTYSATVSGSNLPAKGVTFTILVREKAFELQKLIVDEKVADSTIFNNEATVEYHRRIWPLKELYDDNKYFDGRFILPLEGPITTEFGMLRTVNGKPNPRHDGVDISAGTGTPILAAQNGKVLFADFVKLTGNTVVVEHGYGLKTWYMHMDSLAVKADDLLKTGDTIGKVGATGFVTGPHLHFSASINGVYINPFTLIETDFLEKIK